ncbi:MAG: immunoglobulin domain-containing protein [Verrucomicrobiota bacterium]
MKHQKIKFVIFLAALGIALTAAADPVINNQPKNQTVPTGNDATFSVAATGNGPLQYQWIKDSFNIPGAVSNSFTFFNAQQPDSGSVFSVRVTDLDGFVDSISVILTVVNGPVITVQPQSQFNAPFGTNGFFHVTALGTGPLTYQWKKNDVEIFPNAHYAGETTADLTIFTLTSEDNGQYTVVVTDPLDSITSEVAVLTVASSGGGPLAIITQPQSHLNVPVGTNITFLVEATGDASLQYQWRLNGVNISNAIESTFFISNAVPANAGNYSVAVFDSTGSLNSSIAKLTFNLPFPPSRDNFTNALALNPIGGILRGDNVNATKEPGEPNHAGKRGGRSIWFKWTPQNGGIATFRTKGSGLDTLLAAYTGNNVSNLVQVPSSINDDDRGGFLTSQISFNAVLGQEYKIAVDGFAGERGDVVLDWNLEITPDLLPTVFVMPQDHTANPGQPVTLDYNSDFGQGTWFFNGEPTPVTGNSFTINNVDDTTVGTYEVHIQTLAGREVITTPSRVQIYSRSDGTTDPAAKTYDKFFAAVDASSPPGFLRKPVNVGLVSGFTSSQIFSTLSSSKDPGEPNHCSEPGGASEWYEVQATNSGTLHINTDGSTYNTVLAIYVGPGDSYATLTNVACDNNVSPAGQDRVRFAATPGITYFIALDGVGGTKGSAHLNISLGNPPVITFPPTNKAVALGNNATFTVTATGSATLSYRWQFNGVNISGATGSSYTVTNVQSTNVGFYTVTVSNLVNIVTSAPPASLTLIVPPSINTQPLSQTSNVGSNVTFTVAATGTPSPSFQWRFGGGSGVNIPGATSTSLTVTNVQTTNAGSYRVVVTNSAGSVTSFVAVLSVNVPPVINTQPLSQTSNIGSNVTFTVAATGTPSPSFQWRFGGVGGNIPGATNTSLIVTNVQTTNGGNYRVVVTNSAGSVTSVIAVLTINVPPAINTQPASQTVGSNATANLTVSATGTPAPAYQWQFNTTNLTGQTAAALSVPNFQSTNEGNYRVIVSNSVGTVTSSNALLLLNAPLRFTSFSISTNIFTAQLVGILGTNYFIQVSTNLTNWTSLQTNNAVNGYINFTDTNAAGFSNRFFRGQQQP